MAKSELEPCPWCGLIPIMDSDRSVWCRTIGCGVCGPSDDPTGSKWNEVARIVREYRSGGYLTDEEIERREAGNDA